MQFSAEKKAWSKDEHDAVMRHLKDHIELRKALPGKGLIEECIKCEPCLRDRPWKTVKDYCRRIQAKM